jgi:hypothetical protein
MSLYNKINSTCVTVGACVCVQVPCIVVGKKFTSIEERTRQNKRENCSWLEPEDGGLCVQSNILVRR